MRRKPDILKQFAAHAALNEQLAEATRQAQKFAAQSIELREAGNPKRAARAKAQALQWLIREKGLKSKLAKLEPRPINKRN